MGWNNLKLKKNNSFIKLKEKLILETFIENERFFR